MAYSLKYYGYAHGVHNEGFKVNLYKDDYSGSTYEIELQDMKFKRKENGNILISSVDLSIVNTYDFTEFDDILENYQKQWKLEIVDEDNTSDVFFTGYIVLDVLEKAINENDIIYLTFRDPLTELKEIPITNVTQGGIYDIFTIIRAGLDNVYSGDLYINSALFHGLHTDTNGNSFLEQTYLDADYFYKNNVETNNYFDFIQDVLHAFRCKMYFHKEACYIERLNDISTNTDWVTVNSSDVFSGSSSQHETYNKQTDFDYLRNSQKVLFTPGWSDLELNLDFEEYLSVLPNNWSLPLSEVTYNRTGSVNYPDVTSSDVNIGEWYIMESLGGGRTVETGGGRYGIDNYIKFDISDEHESLIYATPISLYDEGEDTRLKIKYKTYVLPAGALNIGTKMYTRFSIKTFADGATTFIVEGTDGEVIKYTTSSYDYVWQTEVEHDVTEGLLVEFEKTINLEPLRTAIGENTTIIFEFYPTKIQQPALPYIEYPTDQVLGDFEVRVESNNPDNQYNFEINPGYEQQETQNLSFLDVYNYNYRNVLSQSTGAPLYSVIENWSEDGGTTDFTLDEHFVKDIVGYYYKTRRKLDTSLRFDSFTWIKPLAFFDDDNIVDIDFCAKEYTYDFKSSEYTINEAAEYSADKDEIVIT